MFEHMMRLFFKINMELIMNYKQINKIYLCVYYIQWGNPVVRVRLKTSNQ